MTWLYQLEAPQISSGMLLSTFVPCCRRGAAWGIAGIVKGLGIASLKGYGILDAVMAGLNDEVSGPCLLQTVALLSCHQHPST